MRTPHFQERPQFGIGVGSSWLAEAGLPGWWPQMLAMSGVTDCYQSIERRLQLTRRCLVMLAESLNPVSVFTKNHLVTRDIDLSRELGVAWDLWIKMPEVPERFIRKRPSRSSGK